MLDYSAARNVPVLFLIFNRLNTTQQVFSVIRQLQPKYLYVASDGARPDKADEKEKVQTVRDYVLNNIDWDCEVKTLLRQENLGCGRAVSGAITWFFENVEQGIILEDDVLPSLSFFSYCAELLERYKNNNQVLHIAGYNPFGWIFSRASYYFGNFMYCWGWASWRRAWQQYDYNIQGLSEFIKRDKVDKILPKHVLDSLGSLKHIDTWDYQWLYAILKNNGLCVIPKCSLVSNIGFGTDATHTKGGSGSGCTKRYEMLVLKHPAKISLNKRYGKKWHETLHPKYGFLRKSIGLPSVALLRWYVQKRFVQRVLSVFFIEIKLGGRHD
jgi:hypothetical protein